MNGLVLAPSRDHRVYMSGQFSSRMRLASMRREERRSPFEERAEAHVLEVLVSKPRVVAMLSRDDMETRRTFHLRTMHCQVRLTLLLRQRGQNRHAPPPQVFKIPRLA